MTSSFRLYLALPAIAAILMSGCAQPPYIPTDSDAPPLPEGEYRQAVRDGQAAFRIDSERSRVFIRVGRDGPMKASGHDHVVVSEHIEGLVLLGDNRTDSRADIRLPLQRLIVDRPEYRSRFGLDADLSESAINGTTRNMQEKVLESDLYPWIVASARMAPSNDGADALAINITMHGVNYDYVVPIELRIESERLTIAGSMTVQHADFGLTPYSALGGLLRVAETIDIEFEFEAARLR